VVGADSASLKPIEPREPKVIEMNISKCNGSYGVLVINAAFPPKYICGRNFYHVEEILGMKTQVIFTGPKGIGKTICLLAFWVQYTVEKKKNIFLGVNTIKMFNGYAVNHYLQSLGISYDNDNKVSFQNALAKYIEEESPIVLLDLSFMSAAENDVLFLVRLCLSATHCLIAMSSGSGAHFTDSRDKEKVDTCYLAIKRSNLYSLI